MKLKLSLLIGVFVIPLIGNSWAADKTSETLFKKAFQLFDQSLAGDDSVTELALESFKTLSRTYPDNPLFLAYQGSCNTLVGRDAWMPWNKMDYTEKGLDMIGKALRMLKPKHDQETMRGAPISVETRLVAFSTFSGVPKFFHHFEKAKAVLKALFQSPAFGASPPALQAQVYWRAAKIARMENKRAKEIKYLRKILKIDPNGQFAQAARQRL